jgi:hypothetical protein
MLAETGVSIGHRRKSGFSIAMGNASNEVKAQASAVTDSNENEGFAKAVRKFVLPSRSFRGRLDDDFVRLGRYVEL